MGTRERVRMAMAARAGQLAAGSIVLALLHSWSALAQSEPGATPTADLPVQQISAQSALPPQGAPPSSPTATGLPLPRFASLKADNVNLRQGPGSDYRILWIFKRAGLPVEILREHEAWRQVRDSDGTTGWVLSSLLSGRRTAVVMPWNQTHGDTARADVPPGPLPLRDGRTPDAVTIAGLEPGVLATVLSCDGRWCRLAVEDYRGYAEQSQLWGVYRDEVVR